MNIAATIARILLGIVFVAAGAAAFLITSPPAQPGMAGGFNEIFVKSHWSMFVGAAQFVLGALLLVNRFVPLALILLAAFVYNSFAFHITMAPSGLPAPVIVLALGLIVALQHRGFFAPLFVARIPQRSNRESARSASTFPPVWQRAQ